MRPGCYILLSVILVASLGCEEDPQPSFGVDLTNIPYSPSSYEIMVPDDYPVMPIPDDNPTTFDGVNLGRHLFFDPVLSRDSSMSCVSCHLPNKGWADGKAISPGIDGVAGSRSAMTLLNVGFANNGLFWDGRSPSLEMQALLPIEDPLELHDTWDNVEFKLKRNSLYHELFRKAFGISNSEEITRDLAVKALAQFQRTIVASGTSKYDMYKAGTYTLTDLEDRGRQMYFDVDGDFKEVECGHCHSDPLLTANDYFNNGLQEADITFNFADKGQGEIIGVPLRNGFFKAPSLYNVMLTAPYMHDGRLATIDDVLDHYDSGGLPSPTRDGLMRKLELTRRERDAIKAFLSTFTDTSYLSNPMLQDPFKG